MTAQENLLRFGLKQIIRLDPDSEQGRLAALCLAESADWKDLNSKLSVVDAGVSVKRAGDGE